MPDFSHESTLLARGLGPIAGVDEAGRGPLAGPVVAAAVILPREIELPGLADSKKLTARKRELCHEMLVSSPEVVIGIGTASVAEIDDLNILRATHLAMRRAVMSLTVTPGHCLVDGLPVKGLPVPHTALVKGDSLSHSIAAASIIAKVTRDRLMAELHLQYPEFGFSKHQGYGTKSHLQALDRHGPCPAHRSSFAPVAKRIPGGQPRDLFT